MSAPTLFAPRATVGACAALLAVGMMLAAYGPAIVEFESRFGVSGAAAATGLAVQTGMAVLGALAAQPLLRRRGNRFAMRAAMLAMAAGCVVIASAPTWPLTLLGAAIAGLGLGGCDALVTQLFLHGQGGRGPMLVNIAHGCFGLGTVLAPIMLAFLGFENYRMVFVLAATAALAGAVTMNGLQHHPTPADPGPTRTAGPGARTGVLVVGGFGALYVLHFGVQQGVGSWGPSRLLDLGHSGASTSVIVAGYWTAMVLGRFAVAPLAARISPATLVSISCAGMTAAVALAMWPPATVWAYLVAGAFIGPIFPNGLNWLARSPYGRGSVLAYVIAGALAGAALFPLLLGTLIGARGTAALAPALLATAAAALLACMANMFLLSRVRPADADAPTSGEHASPTPPVPSPGRTPRRRSTGVRPGRSHSGRVCTSGDPVHPRPDRVGRSRPWR